MVIKMSNKIIITLTDAEKTFYYDLEVPVDLEGFKLTDDVVQTIISYNPSLLYRKFESKLFIPKLRRYLSDSETLEERGVFNGDYLIIT